VTRVYGEPRSTLDVDIIADVQMRHVEPLVAALAGDFYVDGNTVREAIRSMGSFNAIHLDRAVKVDVFPTGDDPFEAERLAHRQRVRVSQDPPAILFMDTAEHAVVRKLEWYRRGGEVSERPWIDVLGMLRVQAERLDCARMESWAERLGILNLLEEALRQAPVLDSAWPGPTRQSAA
jgi:hypothetical protein